MKKCQIFLQRYFLLYFLVIPNVSSALPSFNEVRAQWQPSDVMILDRQGKPLQRLRIDKQAQRLEWVKLEDVSPALLHALLVSEDKRFYQHSGVDWPGVAAAAWGNLWSNKTRGASTLTMQLTGLLDEDLKARHKNRSAWQKIGQSWSASWLENHWTKAQILEAYLNLVSFRGELVGLSAMSMGLFDKSPNGLNALESAVAAALIRAPNAAVDQVAKRACKILQETKPDDTAACLQVQLQTRTWLMSKKSREHSALISAQWAPHFAQKLLVRERVDSNAAEKGHRPPSKNTSAALISTIDGDLQRYAAVVLRRHLLELAPRNVQDGAIVVLDNRSGDILAWIGSSGQLSTAPEVDGVTALRQAGSTLKPFLYQLALQERWLTAASLIDDSPLDLQTASGLYVPQNYGKDFKGLVSLRSALGSSLNIPAVRTLEMVTPQRLRDRLVDLGLSSLVEDGDYYGYSLALGSADVRLLDLANAYRVLANGGLYSLPRYLLHDAMPLVAGEKNNVARKGGATTQWIRKVDAASSFIITDILSDRVARAQTFGFESVLSTPYWSAVKTGTSKDMRDNWVIGFSQTYTVGVWVGNATGEPMWDVSGMHGAAPIWAAVLGYLEAHQSSAKKQNMRIPPAGVVRRQISYDDYIEASRPEWFLSGTERTHIALKDRQEKDQQAGIVTPLHGSIYALDPDIPVAHQRMLWRSRGVLKAQWWLNGKHMGDGRDFSWFPMPGQHQLTLRDSQGKVIEQIRFTVRGAVLKSATLPSTSANP